jgi:hypothetical protein
MRNCIKCMDEINPKRLEIIPSTRTCVKCSDVERVYGHTIITGKHTYSEIQIVDRETSENMYKLGYRKGQGVSRGVMFKFNSKC